jgi:hypothetical protein
LSQPNVFADQGDCQLHDVNVGIAPIAGLMTFGTPSPGRSWGIEMVATLGKNK